jgi:micrococcal nuclease
VKQIPDHQWVWRARCINVVDGDTIDVEIDAGFKSVRTERIRLLGVNTPEMKKPTYAAGQAAKGFTTSWIELSSIPVDSWPLIIQTHKSDAFGRYLADVWNHHGEHLNSDLIASGNAVEDIR